MLHDFWAAIGALWRLWLVVVAIIIVAYIGVQVLELIQWLRSITL